MRCNSMNLTHAYHCAIRTLPYSTRCTCGVRSNAAVTPSQGDSK